MTNDIQVGQCYHHIDWISEKILILSEPITVNGITRCMIWDELAGMIDVVPTLKITSWYKVESEK